MALGSVTIVPGFFNVSTLPDEIGSRDLAGYGYDEKLYSHSRQFRSNIIDEQKYWTRFYTDAELGQVR